MKLNLSNNIRIMTMRNFLYIIVFFAALIIGCSDESGIVSPQGNLTEEPDWIVLPASEDLSLKKDATVSRWIYGDQESLLEINTDYAGGPFGRISITANARFQRYSFVGQRYITMNVNDEFGTATFSPTGTFSKPVIYNLTIVGVDLSNVNPATVSFVYMSPDGNYYKPNYQQIVVDKQCGRLQILNAELPHFSRYGFIN
jgi:hypothetical protein